MPYKTILIVQNPTLSSQLTHWLATNLLQSTEFLWKQHLPSMISSSFRSRRTLRLCWVSRKISSHAIQSMHYYRCAYSRLFLQDFASTRRLSLLVPSLFASWRQTQRHLRVAQVHWQLWSDVIRSIRSSCQSSDDCEWYLSTTKRA